MHNGAGYDKGLRGEFLVAFPLLQYQQQQQQR